MAGAHSVGLIGLNGAGKTSLLKTFLSLHDGSRLSNAAVALDQLSTWFSGIKIPHQVYYLSEHNPLPDRCRGQEYLYHITRIYPHAVYADPFALTTALGQWISQYSKGQRQQLSLTAAVISQQPLVILDEPATGLDLKARQQLKRVLKSQHSLICSHDLDMIQTQCESLIVMHQRQVIFCGQLDDFTGPSSLADAFMQSIQ